MSWREWNEPGEEYCPQCGCWAVLPGRADGVPGSRDPGDDPAWEPLPGARCRDCEDDE